MTVAYPAYWKELALGLVALFVLKRLLAPSPKYPPGPRGWPIIGNLLQWPKDKEWLTFSDWADEYGDFTHIKLAGTHVVILNKAKTCFDLLEGKGNIYSGRPSRHFACNIVGWRKFLTMSQPDEWWKGQRKLLARSVGTKAVLKSTEAMQEMETARFLRRLLDEPERRVYHIRKLAGAVILNISHGYQVTEGDDEIVQLADELLHEFQILLAPGAFLVDTLPFLDYLPSWFPGTGYRKIGAEYAATLTAFRKRPHNYVREQLAAGTAKPSFVASQIDKPDLTPYEDELVQWTAAVLFGGGADTGVAIISMFFLAITLFPECQKKAQAEIDAVVGTHRLPNLTDRPNLPYCEALLKEVWRWGVIGPQGSPHAALEDDVTAEGYFIPKGAIVVPNVWKFMRDERTYKDAFTFNVDRFLGPAPEQDPRAYTFGFGRRVCPGAELADMSFWLACVLPLAALDVSKAIGPDGQPIVPDVEPDGTLILHPKNFPAVITARSAELEALVRAVPDAPATDAEAFAKAPV